MPHEICRGLDSCLSICQGSRSDVADVVLAPRRRVFKCVHLCVDGRSLSWHATTTVNYTCSRLERSKVNGVNTFDDLRRGGGSADNDEERDGGWAMRECK